MSRFCLCLARFLLSAWVGGAALFVIINVGTLGVVSSPDFDRLTVVRFPIYYRFGFIAVGLSLVALLASFRGTSLPRRRQLIAIILVAAGLALMLYDYRQIYLPLESMITPPGQARPMEFRPLHIRSETFNAIHVGLCLIAALTLCWPAPVLSRSADAQT